MECPTGQGDATVLRSAMSWKQIEVGVIRCWGSATIKNADLIEMSVFHSRTLEFIRNERGAGCGILEYLLREISKQTSAKVDQIERKFRCRRMRRMKKKRRGSMDQN